MTRAGRSRAESRKVQAGKGAAGVAEWAASVVRAAALHVPDPKPWRDTAIAATAMVHGMTVVTRNTSDFEPTGVALFDPWGNR